MRMLVVFVILLALGGCKSTEERLAEYREQCENVGFEEEAAAYCSLELLKAREERKARVSMALQNMGQQMQQQRMQQQLQDLYYQQQWHHTCMQNRAHGVIC